MHELVGNRPGDQLRVRIPTRLPQRMRPQRTVGHRAVRGTTAFRYTHAGMAARSRPPSCWTSAEVAVIESVTANSCLVQRKGRPGGARQEERARRRHRHFVSRGSRLGQEAPDAAVYDARFMSVLQGRANRAEVFWRSAVRRQGLPRTSYVLRVFAANRSGKRRSSGRRRSTTAAQVTRRLWATRCWPVDFSTGSPRRCRVRLTHNAILPAR